MRKDVRSKEEECGNARFCKAVLACILIIAATFFSLDLSGASLAGTMNHKSFTGRAWESLKNEMDIEEALREVGAMVLSSGGIDAWMREELLGEEWLDGAITDGEKKVIWINKEGELGEVRKCLECELGSRGWAIASKSASDATVDTFMKTEGECRWILAEYVQSGKETIVVLRIERN